MSKRLSKGISNLMDNSPSILPQVLLLLLFTFTFGQTIKAQQQKATNTLLWEISGKDLHKPSYLFGTYHFADKGFVDTMKTVNEKLRAANTIVGEIIIDKQIAMKLLPYMVLNGTTLDKLLSPEEYKLVADYLKKEVGYDLKDFNMFKPMVVQTLIMEAIVPKTITKDNPAIDQYFQDYAKANNKNVLGLETVEQQAEILFGNNIERQKELLLKSVTESGKDKQQSKKLYQYYISQNMDGLEDLFLNDTTLTAKEMASLLTDRNTKWIEKLPAMMQDKSLFIVVGAGHLVGKNGLINGLRARGYKVKPVHTM